MRPKLLAFAAAAACLAPALDRAIASPPNTVAESVGLAIPAGDDGARLYVTQGCYQCHGFVGQGSPMSAWRRVLSASAEIHANGTR